MASDSKYDDALERARAERDADAAEAPARAARKVEDEFREAQRDMAEKVKRAEEMGDRVEHDPSTMPPADDASGGTRER